MYVTYVHCSVIYMTFDFVQTFMTVGLADVSSRIGLSSEQEAEKYIRDMVRWSLYLAHDNYVDSLSFSHTIP
jgi:hypothetical protein